MDGTLHPEIGGASGSVSPDGNALSNKIRNVSFDGWLLRGLEETPPQIEKMRIESSSPHQSPPAYVPLPPISCLLKDLVIFTILIIKRKRISPVPLPKQLERYAPGQHEGHRESNADFQNFRIVLSRQHFILTLFQLELCPFYCRGLGRQHELESGVSKRSCK